ncbi:BTAD domain-containing putative transcriptional regulator [Oceanobacillus saliphilus]|uniref:BTAD domain-containing putative transcriptional regulator n=1 Tax=Oceanobacillus saliphilus TaxID=2925834 RepID=UPI00201D7919|nr:BTAD domain-containing putative transcriptional regulator [Oceanobacillus saliphilus]
MRTIPIIQSQLAPPQIRERYVQRSNLNKKLMNIEKYPLTLLYAGAGYGKSTALSLFVHTVNKAVCWFSVSQNDAAIVPFMSKLVQSVKQKHFSFGDSIAQELESLDNYVGSAHIYSLATMFINEIINLEEEVILVLDDFHYAANSSEVENWMLYLLEHIPSNLHMILSSRKKPRWDILPKLKVRGDLLEITQFDLVLSPEEIHYILEDIYYVKVTEQEVTKIYQLTEGWAIAFNMIIQQIEAGTSLETVFHNQKRSLRDLFDYLAAEVLAKQSFIIQQFLMQSSIFEVFTPEICDEVLRINGSEDILAGLIEQNLFIVEGEKNYFRYHALFKAFLENLFLKKHESEYKELHLRAASYFENQEDMESALTHYQKVKEYESIAHLLEDNGLNILQSGSLKTLYDLLVEIPDTYKATYPVLYFYQGEIERYRSLYELAIANYERIIHSLPEPTKENHYLRSLALEGMARIYLDTIQPDKAERFVNQAIYYREKTGALSEDMAKLYLLMAENLLNAGKASKAEVWFERAQQLNPLEESNLQSRIYLRTGRLAKARATLMDRKKYRNNNNQKHLPQSHRETDILLSIIEAFMGNAEVSRTLASDGIQLGLSIQAPFVEACGWMRLGHAVQLTDYYDTDLAIKCYETALEIMGKINISRGKAEPYMGLSILYGKRQEYNRSIDNAMKGLKETEKVNDRWLSALIKLGMVITEVYNQNFEQAWTIKEQVRADMKSCGDRYGIMVTAFWGAYISFERDEEHQFKNEMKRFLHEVQTEEYEFFLKKKTVFGPTDMQNMAPLLLKANELGISQQYVSRLMYELNLNESIKNHPGYTLRINTLGQFRIWLGTKQIEPQDWQRGKAKELLELLITNRDKLLQKEEIFQFLWPDQDEANVNKSFKVALNALLKVLEPHRKAREESFFITREGSGYGLNPDSGYQLDSIMFEDLITAGLGEVEPKRAMELLEKGLKLYQGDYMSDLRFTTWCSTERERLQQLFLRGAEKMAQVAVRLLKFNVCMGWCEKILLIDRTWEEAYRLMMYSYYQNNNRPQAMKWYEKCYEALDTELGVEPMESTREMYEMIMESEELNTY